MNHSYEEIRDIVLDLLSGREKAQYELSQFEHLACGVAEVFQRRENEQQPRTYGEPQLTVSDKELVRDVFWDLFRQGIIILGYNDANPKYPFFRLSHNGQKILENSETYFFYDISSYEKAIKKEVPKINDITLIYLKEAMQAFRAGCLLSSSVMLGVATEHTFLLLIEIIDQNPEHKLIATAVNKETTILRKINKFKNKLDEQAKLTPEIKEDLDTYFAGILSVLRNYRNQSGHPTGKIIDREQMYVLLNLFISYCKKMYQLMNYYENK
jgi:hypothetical protein